MRRRRMGVVATDLMMVFLMVQLKVRNLHLVWHQRGLVLMERIENLFVTWSCRACPWLDRREQLCSLGIGLQNYTPHVRPGIFVKGVAGDGGSEPWMWLRIFIGDGLNQRLWKVFASSPPWRLTQCTCVWGSVEFQCCWGSFLKLFDVTLWVLATCRRCQFCTVPLWCFSLAVEQKGRRC